MAVTRTATAAVTGRTMAHVMSRVPTRPKPFKGNKSYLPSKPCQACGRAMTWRKRWARDWNELKFCSAACRSGQRVHGGV